MLRPIFLAALLVGLGACSDGSDSKGGAVVDQPPTVSALSDQSVMLGGGPLVVEFTVGDDFTGPMNLAITASSADESLVANEDLVVMGTGADRSLQITPQAGQLGSVMISLRVEDAQAQATEQSFSLTVSPMQVGFGAFVREVFALDADAAPRPINQLELLPEDGDFNDLLQ